MDNLGEVKKQKVSLMDWKLQCIKGLLRWEQGMRWKVRRWWSVNEILEIEIMDGERVPVVGVTGNNESFAELA